MRSKSRVISYLFRFMLIFEINRFWIFSASERTVNARVGWADDGTPDYDEDEEVQDIEWDVQDFDNFEDALKLSELLIDQKLMLNDRITIDVDELFNRIGWERDRYDAAVNTLLSVKIDMLDEGKKTDYFFVHF
ncbi:hypothetical protein MNBD_GAMMA18-1386 [hydrothermal vent metagenome]|uniref:Uncharacterized protein n=1 Tax=hydrothermal vent metagenome TaxID=652676 RepID=A0A3B0ZRM5_9ZZZZ